MSAKQASKSLLRLTTAGSVDDGKSTLIGRLLYEAKALFDDQLSAIENKKTSTGELDLSLVTDGLKSEREQGITIDVAYKYFSSAYRKYILADAPGHVQYTRNMVTAASLADAAIILVDARHGVIEQTRRHAFLIHLLGVRHVVLAINKIDLIEYDQSRIEQIETEFRQLSWNQNHPSLHAIPLSALVGDNVSNASSRTPWYDGPSLIDLLDQLDSATAEYKQEDFYLPIQYVFRSGQQAGRLAAGTIQKGKLQVGDPITILPSMQNSQVAAIYVAGEKHNEARAGQAVAVAFTDERDLERGFQVSADSQEWQSSQDINADLVWFDDEPFVPERLYIFRSGVQTSRAKVGKLQYRFDLSTLSEEATDGLRTNDIARVQLSLTKASYLKSFAEDRYLGSFILIDPQSNRTVAAGIVKSLSRNENLTNSKQRLVFVDQLSVEKPAGKSLQLPESFLQANSLQNVKQAIESLLEIGWEIQVEIGNQDEIWKRELKDLGFASFVDGAGI